MAKFLDKFKKTIGLEPYYDEYEYDDDEHEITASKEKQDNRSKSDEAATKEVINYDKYQKRSNVMPLQASPIETHKIQIHEPLQFDDGPKIVEDILGKRVVVLNLEMLEMEMKKRIFDFVSGAIYALNGTVQKVTKDIFVIAPSNVIIDGKLKEQIQSKGFFQF